MGYKYLYLYMWNKLYFKVEILIVTKFKIDEIVQ
jgi:hypothetical protein